MNKQKKDILKTASGLFSKYGLKSVSIDDICSGLGISKKTFYNYFKQKSDLVLEVLQSMHEQREEMAKETAKLENDETKNAIDRIMAIRYYFKANQTKSNHSFFYDLTKYYPKIHEEFSKQRQEETIIFIKKEIEKGIAEGIFRKELDLDLTAYFLTIQFQNIVNTLKKNTKFQTVFDFMVDVYIRLVANEKGLKYYEENYLKTQTTKQD